MSHLRFALRLWRKNPSVVLMAVVALGLGIGASTAVFSVVRAVLLRPLAYRAPHELVMVWEKNLPRRNDTNVVSPGNYIHWRERNRTFAELGFFSFSGRINLTGLGEPREVPFQVVTASLFDVLGVRPQFGRTFLAEEDHPDPTTVVVSDRFWRRVLNGDPAAVGRALTLGARSYTVVGVMPVGFAVRDPTVDLWLPAGLAPTARTPRGRGVHVIGRLKPGVSAGQAQTDMSSVSAGLVREFPAFNTGWTVNVVPLQEDLVGRLRMPLLVLFGAIALVLFVACANVANLLLAQASARQRELAVRTALGAARGRLVRQLLIESTTLALVGGATGMLLAWTSVRLLRALPLEQLPVPRLAEVTIDVPIAVFALVVSLATGVLFGTAPALTASAVDLQSTLKEGTRGAGMRRGARTRAMLVVAEVALSVVLLAGAGLLIRSFIKVMQVPLGFETSQLVTARVDLPNAVYREDHQRVDFFARLLEDLEALPGVTSAGAVSFLPLTGAGAATKFIAIDQPRPDPGGEPTTDVRVISGDYLGAMGIPLLRGRVFTAADSTPTARVVIVNDTLARTIWPGEDPIGKRMSVSWGEMREPDTVVGVVGDIRHGGAQTAVRPMIYWPHAAVAYRGLTVVARTTADPASIAALLPRVVRARDSNQPPPTVETIEQVIAASVRERRLIMMVLGVFAGLALVLAAVGIYGVLAYTVAQRTHEIGVRMAIGASRGDVMRLVLRQTLWLAGSGVFLGTLAAVAATRLMRTLLFEIEPGDPLTLAAVIVALVGVALLASFVPGRRATRIDPIVALRYE